MREECHRCHGELPAYDPGAPEPANGYDARAVLFCPHCSAPQLLLQEHMVHTAPVADGPSTGTVPPPHPHQLHWQVALRVALLVAAIAAGLKTLAFAVEPASYFANVWVAGIAFIAVTLYANRLPGAWMDAPTGLRIGFATGLLTLSAIAIAFAIAGVAARFGLHRMGGFDVELTQQFAVMQTQMTASLQQQNGTPAMQQKLIGVLAAPETRAGYALFSLALKGSFVMSLAMGGGALAGMLRDSRRRIAPSRP